MRIAKYGNTIQQIPPGHFNVPFWRAGGKRESGSGVCCARKNGALRDSWMWTGAFSASGCPPYYPYVAFHGRGGDTPRIMGDRLRRYMTFPVGGWVVVGGGPDPIKIINLRFFRESRGYFPNGAGAPVLLAKGRGFAILSTRVNLSRISERGITTPQCP